MRYPKFYWSIVSERACALQDEKPGIDPQEAYKLGRNEVDTQIVERETQLELQKAHYPDMETV